MRVLQQIIKNKTTSRFINQITRIKTTQVEIKLNKVENESIERWKPLVTNNDLKSVLQSYQGLSKAKLAALVGLSSMCGYAAAPGGDLFTLLFSTIGTGLCISSANTFNQFIEIPYDSQMSRTKNRVLVNYKLSTPHTFYFGLTCGLSGVSTLYYFVNPTVAMLGLSNIILYSCIYTPLKRYSIVNTWVGSVVGAIPPMMGWVSCTNNITDPGAWLLGLVLYCWQFPHFNSLAYNLRSDYSKAGYQMMAVTDPNLNSRVSLRYSLLLIPVSLAFPYFGITSTYFLLSSSLVNSYMLWKAFIFWSRPNDSNARSLFFSSLIHLPLLLVLVLFHKNNSDKNQVE